MSYSSQQESAVSMIVQTTDCLSAFGCNLSEAPSYDVCVTGTVTSVMCVCVFALPCCAVGLLVNVDQSAHHA